jgi:hypothetical protein
MATVGGVVEGEFCVTNFGWFGAWRGSAEPWMGIGSTVTVRVGWRPLRRMWLRRCSMNFAHVPVVYARHLPIVPGDRDRIPTRLRDSAAISGIASPIHSGALLETLGFGDCHCHPFHCLAVAQAKRPIFKVRQKRESSEIPRANAFWRVAPSDRFRLRAIFAAGTFFRASDFNSRTCAVVHARLFDPFFISFSICRYRCP